VFLSQRGRTFGTSTATRSDFIGLGAQLAMFVRGFGACYKCRGARNVPHAKT
jgi:hypothetical protein